MKKLESGLLRLSCLLRGVTTVLLFWGGIHLHHRWESASNLLYRYDPRGNLWIKGALMNQRRVDFYLGTMGDCLIAVEGSNDSGALSSVEVYHPAEDYWTYVAGLPRFTYGHEGIIHKGIVYISRGYDYRCDMLSYDPKTADTWTERQAMILARGWHSMASLDNRICVIGGSGNHEDSMERFDVLGWKPLTRRLISGPR